VATDLMLCFPHTRGGEPAGWLFRCKCGLVFPTPVGVNQSSILQSVQFEPFSPHPWG